MINLRQVILARSIRQVAAIFSLDYRLDLVGKLRDRYSFIKVPTTVDELLGVDPAEGIKFQHGRFVRGDRSFVVELLQFLASPAGTLMIVCDTRTSTDDCDLFLDDYVKQANLARPDMITPTEPTLHLSQIEFTMERSIKDLCRSPLTDVGQSLHSILAGYGQKTPSFELTGIIVNFDRVDFGGIPPAHFSLERRMGFRHETNTYFSQAPLKTQDHVAVLEHLARAPLSK